MSTTTAPLPPIRLITDSAVDLPPEIIKEKNITVVPLNIALDGKIYRDGVDAGTDKILNLIRRSKNFPENPPPDEAYFHEKFLSLIAEEDLLVIFLSSKMGKMFNIARLTKGKHFIKYVEARRQAGNETDRIRLEIMTNGVVSLPAGLILMEAADKIAAGWDIDRVKAHVESLIPRARLLLMVDSLKYLALGGRISYALKQIGTLLRFKPILHIDKGVIDMRDRVIGARNLQKRVIELMKEDTGRLDTLPRVSIGHVQAPEKAESMERLIETHFNPQELMTMPLGPVVSMHTGPGTVGVAYLLPEE